MHSRRAARKTKRAACRVIELFRCATNHEQDSAVGEQGSPLMAEQVQLLVPGSRERTSNRIVQLGSGRFRVGSQVMSNQDLAIREENGRAVDPGFNHVSRSRKCTRGRIVKFRAETTAAARNQDAAIGERRSRVVGAGRSHVARRGECASGRVVKLRGSYRLAEGVRASPSEQDLPARKQSGRVQEPGSNHATGCGKRTRRLRHRHWAVAAYCQKQKRKNKLGLHLASKSLLPDGDFVARAATVVRNRRRTPMADAQPA